MNHVIHCEEGPETVTATEAAPGLLIYEVPASVSVGNPNRWSVGTSSGLAVAMFPSEQAATGAAEDLAELANWTASTDELRDLFFNHSSTSARARELLWGAVNTHEGQFPRRTQ